MLDVIDLWIERGSDGGSNLGVVPVGPDLLLGSEVVLMFRTIQVLPTRDVVKRPNDPMWIILEATEGHLRGEQITVMYRKEPEEFGPPRRHKVSGVENISLGKEEWEQLQVAVREAVRKHLEVKSAWEEPDLQR